MKNSTAQSNRRSSANFCQHERRNSTTAGARGGAHGLVQRQIEASTPYQYRLPDDGRKCRIQCQHRQRLALYLVGYRACYPGLKRIARDLGWSRATVARVMSELKKLGVMKPMGYVAEHGTRLRVLKPEALRSRESETPARRESETQELPKTLELPKSGDTAKSAEGDTPKTGAALSPFKRIVEHTPESAFEAAQRIFRSWLGLDAHDAQGLACWIAYRALRVSRRNWPETTTYYMIAAKNFFEQHNPFVANALIAQGYNRLWPESETEPYRRDVRRTHVSAAERRKEKTREALDAVFGPGRDDTDEEEGFGGSGAGSKNPRSQASANC